MKATADDLKKKHRRSMQRNPSPKKYTHKRQTTMVLTTNNKSYRKSYIKAK